MKSLHDLMIEDLLYLHAFCRVEDDDPFQKVSKRWGKILEEVCSLRVGGYLDLFDHRLRHL